MYFFNWKCLNLVKVSQKYAFGIFLVISYHCVKWWIGTIRQPAIIGTNNDSNKELTDLYNMVALGCPDNSTWLTLVRLLYHIEAWTEWLPFCRWHSKMHTHQTNFCSSIRRSRMFGTEPLPNQCWPINEGLIYRSVLIMAQVMAQCQTGQENICMPFSNICLIVFLCCHIPSCMLVNFG